eukprot:TRINITY_DN23655_c0_g3_i1.p1 TRINITY_DN23655_c0_g3~~TRINITY_DN23655_c0_g3_i1.p1  ORF type:complete len:302 (+),score=38.12 TRINITY_DN23655_c0_g3_i1:78-983(+)
MPARDQSYKRPAETSDDDSESDSGDELRSGPPKSLDKMLGVAVIVGVVLLVYAVCALSFRKPSETKTSGFDTSPHLRAGGSVGDTVNVADATFVIWTLEDSDQECGATVNKFMRKYNDDALFANAFEGTEGHCAVVVGFKGTLVNADPCADATAFGATRCGTYRSPSPTEDVRSRFPTVFFLRNLGERQSHVVSISFHATKSAETAHTLLSMTSELLRERRAESGNVFSNMLQGTGRTDSSEFVWLEEWTSGDGHITNLDDKPWLKEFLKQYIAGSLIDLVASPGGDQAKGAPWSHVGGMR